jgi:iron(III) transport system substrate-binding protein
MKKLFFGLTLLSIGGCFISDTQTDAEGNEMVVNVYSHHHYDVDKEIYSVFEKETGVKVNVVEDDADKLMIRLESEGEKSPCDILITADAGRLVKAKEKGLLQEIESAILKKNVPKHLRDKDGYWYAQTVRARIIVYNPETVSEDSLSTYEDLAHPKWKGKILVRSSENIYNQSLMASMIANNGYRSAFDWALNLVDNFAREPKGNDREQVAAIAAGEGDIAIINTYYLGKMLESENPEEVSAAKKVKVFFPNQNDRGAHINISGGGIVKNAPHKEYAIKLLEFISRPENQEKFASANNEYPLLENIKLSPILESWGKFKADNLPLNKLGEHLKDALVIFNESGWK